MIQQIRKLLRLRRAQRQRIALREHHRARRRYSRYMRVQRAKLHDDLELMETEKQAAIEQERRRVNVRLAELEHERRQWVQKNEFLHNKIRQVDEEIGRVKEIRARMEGAFALVSRALGLANAAVDDIEKLDNRVTDIKKHVEMHFG